MRERGERKQQFALKYRECARIAGAVSRLRLLSTVYVLEGTCNYEDQLGGRRQVDGPPERAWFRYDSSDKLMSVLVVCSIECLDVDVPKDRRRSRRRGQEQQLQPRCRRATRVSACIEW